LGVLNQPVHMAEQSEKAGQGNYQAGKQVEHGSGRSVTEIRGTDSLKMRGMQIVGPYLQMGRSSH
jgi:hypothetical protein